ncbi:MAG: fused MFS/spermidine synthase, partial [Candidatus Omnitrophica bacterium]|nr:fused MFS/spermidine synthase [Candidatus Omnitrophota bacterium]
LGGLLVSWVFPLVSTVMIEYVFGLFLIAFALIFGEKKEKVGFLGMRLILYLAIAIIIWPIIFRRYNIFGIMVMIFAFHFIFSRFKNMPRPFYLGLLMVLVLTSIAEPLWGRHRFIYKHRNYYGIYKIYDERGQRYLSHGSILHGMQNLAEAKKDEPLTYYHRKTLAGRIINNRIFGMRRIGLVGLGTGTLASYFNCGEEVDFFEIDPDMAKVASEYFTFLKDASANIRIILGDARLSLEGVADNRYDLLVIDAFSGDSIPMHLLTIEAFELYKKCLTNQGVILFHVSNRYLDLSPVLFGNANTLGAYACEDFDQTTEEESNSGKLGAVWVAVTWNKQIFEQIVLFGHPRATNEEPEKNFRPWTDKYSSVYKILKLNDPLSEIKDFRLFYW